MVTQPQVHAAPRTPLRVITTPLHRVENLLALLPTDESAAWVRRGEGLIGWGVAARLQVRGDERFSAPSAGGVICSRT